MPDQTEPAVISDAEQRETLDLMATVIAGMTDTLDDYGTVLSRVEKRTAEARSAAFAARDRTDPKRFGSVVAEAFSTELGDTIERMAAQSRYLEVQTEKTVKALAKAEDDRSRAYRTLFEREERITRRKRLFPVVVLGAAFLAMVLTVLLPRFMAGNPATCAVIGASWITTTAGTDACVFFRE